MMDEGLDENGIAKLIVDAAYHIHRRTGPGLLESVYEAVLAHELGKRGLTVERQVCIPLQYDELLIPDAFRADLIVNRLVIVEVKSIEDVHPVHKKQVLTYLRLANLRLGLLINFGSRMIADGIHRIVNGLPEAPPQD